MPIVLHTSMEAWAEVPITYFLGILRNFLPLAEMIIKTNFWQRWGWNTQPFKISFTLAFQLNVVQMYDHMQPRGSRLHFVKYSKALKNCDLKMCGPHSYVVLHWVSKVLKYMILHGLYVDLWDVYGFF